MTPGETGWSNLYLVFHHRGLIERSHEREIERDIARKRQIGREVHVYRDSEREMEWQRYREIERGK